MGASMSEGRQREALKAEAQKAGEMYHATVTGGLKDQGRKEVAEIARTAEGKECLKVLEKVLTNVYRYPTTDQYKSVNLSKGAGAKLRPALALMRLVGFESKSDNGEERAVLVKPNLDKISRLTSMIQWAVDPKAVAVTLPTPAGTMAGGLGALLGVAVGDALGAPLEMTGRS